MKPTAGQWGRGALDSLQPPAPPERVSSERPTPGPEPAETRPAKTVRLADCRGMHPQPRVANGPGPSSWEA